VDVRIVNLASVVHEKAPKNGVDLKTVHVTAGYLIGISLSH